jgi:hypothetical protein
MTNTEINEYGFKKVQTELMHNALVKILNENPYVHKIVSEGYNKERGISEICIRLYDTNLLSSNIYKFTLVTNGCPPCETSPFVHIFETMQCAVVVDNEISNPLHPLYALHTQQQNSIIHASGGLEMYNFGTYLDDLSTKSRSTVDVARRISMHLTDLVETSKAYVEQKRREFKAILL